MVDFSGSIPKAQTLPDGSRTSGTTGSTRDAGGARAGGRASTASGSAGSAGSTCQLSRLLGAIHFGKLKMVKRHLFLYCASLCVTFFSELDAILCRP